MDISLYINNGHKNLMISIFLALVSWLTPETVELIIKVLVGVGSIVAAIFACINYYYSIKKNKLDIKRGEKNI